MTLRSSFHFPPGARVLHIGPHKTGTTSVQRSLHDARDEVAAQGLHYAGATSQPIDEVLSMLARENPRPPFDAPSTDRPWRRLVKEVNAQQDRTVLVSSEFFADARESAVRRAVAELGGDDPYVLVTLRPLPRIMPSQWQQYVQNGMKTGYGKWLKAMLREPETTTLTPSFWWRHRHDRLVARWAEVVGPDRVVVVVLDESDPEQLLRDVEGLFSLRAGTLPTPVVDNRSLTWPEIELLREFNRQFAKSGLPRTVHHHAIRFGVARYLQQRTPAPDEPRLLTPRWAAREAAELGGRMGEWIAASGVQVVGDPSTLGAMPTSGLRPKGARTPDPILPPELGAAALMGLVHASGLPEVVGRGKVPEAMLGAQPVPTAGFARATWRRARDRVRRLVD
ncbi:hypothetical protein [Aeromicrobium duanguangcaii]|uniref:Sulfotransferase family protein n=1 Tax=Aeromicrobium duanguangcaii TaxID=2968086 RepID=A0ABY5KD23_9ACTN|nr:hypothetical protein [Aeromicrobium duanguangcaii]MCD9155371.1 hypothetical protein [Aeromicrobium duanguangcaii]MCL3838339.1 hypothetical protein [Aeromicrobium duanguangcaii]UUI68357.1 hypothetical protein NP095_14285 [Aeromicrobium duanguangcaii]